jgi:biotin carboxylase
VHVQSKARLPDCFQHDHDPTKYIANFSPGERSSIDDLVTNAATWKPACVLPGTETGVELADALAHQLGLAGNDPRTSLLRRDKFQMHEALRSRGLSDLRQAKCFTLPSALDWAAHTNSWPLVVKPPASAGADGVRFCSNLPEVEDACAAVLSKTNRLGLFNDAVVLQERIAGQQYIVNAVSQDARHFISEIWRDDKLVVGGAALICDREVLLSADDPVAALLDDYVCDALKALGIAEGPSHSELFLREDVRPILVETAARMQGTIDHEAVIEATAHSHVTLTALRYADPVRFAELIGSKYRRQIHLHCVTLAAKSAGIVVNNRCPELIGGLRSFRSLLHMPNVGDQIYATIDLFTSPGIAYIANANEELLEQDYKQIRAWERDGELFLVAPEGKP